MISVHLAGVMLISVGLLAAIWPYRVARFQEAIDAIGSTRKLSEVEPANWRVILTQASGLIIIVAGIVILVDSVYSVF